MGFGILQGAEMRSVGSGQARTSPVRVREAVCTIANDVFLTLPKTVNRVEVFVGGLLHLYCGGDGYDLERPLGGLLHLYCGGGR